jgi:parallel beta-helix repeat protein
VNSGTSSAWIRFVAYNNEQVTLQGSANACSLGGACHGVQVIKTYDGIVPQFVQVAGFTITGFDGNCITVQSNSDVVLSSLDVSACHNGAVELHSTSRVTLETSRVHDNHMMGWTSAVDLYQCNSGNVVRGNTIWQNYDDTTTDSEGHGITMDVCGAAGGALIENNLIYNNEGWCIEVYKSDNAVIRNNVCWVNGIRSPSGEIDVYGNNMQVHNNIAVPRSGAPGLNMRYNSSYTVDITTLTEDYNIVWASTHTSVVMWSDGSSQGTVAQYQSGNPRGWGAHDLQLDPMLVDPSGARDFRPRAGSPAIDSGDNGHAAAVDFFWHARPWDGDGNGSAIVDRGAFEYGSP